MTGLTDSVLALLSGLTPRIPAEKTLIVIIAAMVVGIGIWYLGARLQRQFQAATAELIRAGLLLLVAVAGMGILLNHPF